MPKSNIKKRLVHIKPIDILVLGLFLITVIPAMLYRAYLRLLRKPLWVFSEGFDSARDNGYVLYEYTRKNYPAILAYYAIDTKSKDANKISSKDRVVQYGSIRHWILYMAASKNISNHKSAAPSLSIFYVLHKLRIIDTHRILLQHGVIMNKLEYLFYGEAFFELFVCSAAPEYEYVRDSFGHPKGVVQYLGLPRFDNLQHAKVNQKKIMIMPTWRSWLTYDGNPSANHSAFIQSDYYMAFQSLINNPELIKFVEKNNMSVYFYLHPNMQKHKSSFSTNSKSIFIVGPEDTSIQDLIASSVLMITDYSSVGMDFGYMKKPIIYYQFDLEKFRTSHLSEGYFSYEADGFGPTLRTEIEVVEAVENIMSKDTPRMDDFYLKRLDNFFVLSDANNCKRVIEAIINIEIRQGRNI